MTECSDPHCVAVNVHEARARSAKAYRLARTLLRAARAAPAEHGRVAADWIDAPPLVRARAARAAGVRVPSETTWETAVMLLDEMLRDDA